MNLAEEEPLLVARAAGWDGPALTSTSVAALAREQGVDFATAVLHERVLRVEANARFLQEARRGPSPPPRDVLLGIVPGAFHREHRHTGADGARVLSIARALGLSAELIPTRSFGRLAENARVIHEWLAAREGRRLGLVSLSKGGADVKHALADPAAAARFGYVEAWISFSGTVQGTPLAQWLQDRKLRWWAVRLMLWWRRQPWRTMEDLQHGPGTTLASWPSLPTTLRVVHVCGFPLRRHVAHPWARRAHARLAPLGPNDGGGNLLADTLEYPGIVCPVWGADHYLAPAWDSTPLLTGIVAAALARA